MTELGKITPSHRARLAVVYIRQSTSAQVESNRESTARQYQLQAFASEFGWPAAQIRVIDQDLGRSGSGLSIRSGFAELAAEVALGHVGIVLALEVSRLARNNADWYRLLDLCGTTDTLIGDADGLYHPGLFNLETAVDRFVQDTSIGLVADFALGSTSPFGCRPLRSPGHAPRGARLRYNSLE